ncbi:rhomboid family intramembrane serine protease [Aquibacillus rhizosphaerae]|uniref:Rhomboid family intramembrane serine protease n=1 Tax=Aquibacillus rhizosphaerae TaxID=3051431 RepID=A0ABT7L6R3_9BACI|nr:rhomboid family intramembrane serine protease [Aquibacillus sp. LR5S19]MDL4841545.1 rhomboid family intramembrane serine protease [Aquibacillus sp. LR5S19]
MFLEEKYLLNRLTYNFIHDYECNIVLINNRSSEVWLEKKIKGKSHLIRIIQRSFDWQNRLKQEVDLTIENVKKLKRLIIGRSVHVHNVYIATHPPVDEWEYLKKPISIKDNKFTTMNVYYLDEDNREYEAKRLHDNIGIDYKPVEFPNTEIEMEQLTHYLKTLIDSEYQKNIKETEKLFQNGKPVITYLLLIANILMYIVLDINGGSTNPEVLVNYGAKYNPAIIDGEWWRIISSMFLHIGSLHLFMNMLALFYVGTAVERMYGSTRYSIIYFLAGIVGGLSSFAFSPQIAAGASGALFGLFGALLFFGINYKRVFFQTMGWNVIFVIILNILCGLLVPSIDNSAHMGGLLGGFIASSIVFFPKKKKWFVQLISFIVYIGIISGLILYGLSNTSVEMDETLQLQRTQELIEAEKFDEVVEITSKAIKYSNDTINYSSDYEAELLFYRSFALIQLDDLNKAKKDLEKVVMINPDMAEAHYNLAILFLDEGNSEKAISHAKTALELQPDNRSFADFHQRLLNEG